MSCHNRDRRKQGKGERRMCHEHRQIIIDQRHDLPTLLNRISAEGWDLAACTACRVAAQGQDLIQGVGEVAAWNLIFRRPARSRPLAQGELPIGEAPAEPTIR
ncbi:MAG: hypothetical protein K2R98_08610 [Gemmataceae bacterium]|nr:hypothetical protein [Gemmataceae bacterium]